MLAINWIKLAPYIAVLILITGLGAYGKYEHSQRVKIEQEYTDFRSGVNIAAKLAQSQADAALGIANGEITSQRAKAAELEDNLTKLGITKEQTKKDLTDAYTKLNNFKSANSLLWKQTSDRDTTASSETPSVLPVPPGSCDETSSRLEALETANIYTVKDYRACTGQLETIYKQFNQPIQFKE